MNNQKNNEQSGIYVVPKSASDPFRNALIEILVKATFSEKIDGFEAAYRLRKIERIAKDALLYRDKR